MGWTWWSQRSFPALLILWSWLRGSAVPCSGSLEPVVSSMRQLQPLFAEGTLGCLFSLVRFPKWLQKLKFCLLILIRLLKMLCFWNGQTSPFKCIKLMFTSLLTLNGWILQVFSSNAFLSGYLKFFTNFNFFPLNLFTFSLKDPGLPNALETTAGKSHGLTEYCRLINYLNVQYLSYFWK